MTAPAEVSEKRSNFSGVLRTGSSTENKEFTDIAMGCCGVMDGLITF